MTATSSGMPSDFRIEHQTIRFVNQFACRHSCLEVGNSPRHCDGIPAIAIGAVPLSQVMLMQSLDSHGSLMQICFRHNNDELVSTVADDMKVAWVIAIRYRGPWAETNVP